ncbi:unnamed protein product, partial [Ectocarpus sp. 12 AP-2014]
MVPRRFSNPHPLCLLCVNLCACHSVLFFVVPDELHRGNKESKDEMGIKGFPSFRMFEGTLESAKEHKPPRVMPQLMEYFKAIK